jgi:hypothetical protein
VPATIAVNNATVWEGNNLVFNISLNHSSCYAVTFTPSLASGTATVGTDTGTPVYYSLDGGGTLITWTGADIIIPSGVTTVTFIVPSVNDVFDEQTETFTITASVTSGNTSNTSASGIGTILDNDIEISGTVFNDLDRLTDFTVDGTGTNAGGLYASLTNPVTHEVIACVSVNASGTYSFNSNYHSVMENTQYLIILTTAVQYPGGTLTSTTLPNGWISTGEHVGAGPGDDGTVDGQLLVSTTTNGVTEANFGIVRVPDVTPVITAIPNVMHGITNFDITVRTTELNLVNTNGLITIKIPKDTRWVFNGPYDPGAVIIGGTPVNNANWNYSQDAVYHIFTTTVVIPAGGFSTFGFHATFDPGATKGVYTITSQINSYSGGENRIDNNVDAERLDYFIF